MENNNSVCFVAKIEEIKPIEGADNIELGLIGGWNCIIKKGEYKSGDLVVCATTDAVIPQALSDAIGITSYLRKGQRVRTVKLRGIYSECLIIPTPKSSKYVEGQDLMKELGISKYEPPVVQIQLASGKKIRFTQNPNFHVYYKFPNLKNVKGMFTEEDDVQITTKIHGTNARYSFSKKHKLTIFDKTKLFLNSKFGWGGYKWKWCDYEYLIGSHNVIKGSDTAGFYSTDVWLEISNKYDIKNKILDLVHSQSKPLIGSGVTIYGEIYGPGIQKNYDYGLKELKFEIFDVTVDNKYLGTKDTELVSSIFPLPHVEILYEGKWNQTIQDKFTFDRFIEGTKIPHEGIVIKEITGDRRKIAKVINPSYLIYGEKHDVGDSH